MNVNPYEIPPFLGAFFSLVLCSHFLWRTLPRVQLRYSRRLFLRQIWHLAAADIVFTLGALVVDGATFLFIPEEHGDAVCWALSRLVWLPTMGTGFCVSVLLEAHIAVGFVSGMARSSCLHRFMDKSVLLMWPAGLLLSCIDASLFTPGYQDGDCVPKNEAAIVLYLVVLVVVVSFFSYVCVTVMICQGGPERFPRNVQRRVWMRAGTYCCITVALFGPYIGTGLARQMDPDVALVQHFWTSLVATMVSINGAANVLAYGMQSRYVRRLRHTASQQSGSSRGASGSSEDKNAPRGTPPISYHVRFEGGTSEVRAYLPTRSPSDTTPTLSDPDIQTGGQCDPGPVYFEDSCPLARPLADNAPVHSQNAATIQDDLTALQNHPLFWEEEEDALAPHLMAR